MSSTVLCEVLGCTNKTSYRIKGTSFHTFPTDESVKQKWIDVLTRDGWSPNPQGRVCSLHFKAGDVLKNPPRRALLVRTAVPSIFPALDNETSINSINNTTSNTTNAEMKVSSNVTFQSSENVLAANTNIVSEDDIRSKFSVISELANDMNSIRSKIRHHLKVRRAKNCRMRGKIEKLKRLLAEVKEESAINNPVLTSLFENAQREPPDTAIDQQLDDPYLSRRSSQDEILQSSESTDRSSIKDPFVSHLTAELKKLLPEDYALIKRDIQNILETKDKKITCVEL